MKRKYVRSGKYAKQNETTANTDVKLCQLHIMPRNAGVTINGVIPICPICGLKVW